MRCVPSFPQFPILTLLRMAYIEENMKLRKGAKEEKQEDDGPADPYAELFRLTDKNKKKEEEGNVTNSLAMLTAIPEVDLGMECVLYHASPCTSLTFSHDDSTRLKNIEETEKAKRLISEQRKERMKADDEAHLAAARCMPSVFDCSCAWNADDVLQSTDRTSRPSRTLTSCEMPNWKLWGYGLTITSIAGHPTVRRWLRTRLCVFPRTLQRNCPS